MKQRTWTHTEETKYLSDLAKPLNLRCMKADNTYVFIDRNNMFFYQEENYDKCVEAINKLLS